MGTRWVGLRNENENNWSLISHKEEMETCKLYHYCILKVIKQKKKQYRLFAEVINEPEDQFRFFFSFYCFFPVDTSTWCFLI